MEAVGRWEGLAAVQVIYNIFDPTPAERLFPLCRERGIGIIARVPLDEGGLTGAIAPSTTFPPGDYRAGYFAGDRPAQVAERVARLLPVVKREAATLVEGALRFCLSHPAVSTVIPGMRTEAHARANCAAGDKGPLSGALLAELARHAWPRDW
jgi:aryl-alcohol dehydrogenase-like predicted oxidoreductase